MARRFHSTLKSRQIPVGRKWGASKSSTTAFTAVPTIASSLPAQASQSALHSAYFSALRRAQQDSRTIGSFGPSKHARKAAASTTGSRASADDFCWNSASILCTSSKLNASPFGVD
eukprot:CAMPEP_0196749008 /NCGR_PEP_ID=MMETSP1091-20130531/75332_1 /TAXON_ID=302021 /ORGANISM="Rhodomonas sp., Strain CCMP768" /LENGTH=115 /DNA_ID=CAMNT_0042096409 /DNA_START=119 /DNA_END=464 /DNA_ORIENTATION=-